MKLLTGCLTLAAMLCCMPASQAEMVIDNFAAAELRLFNGTTGPTALTGDVTGTRTLVLADSGFGSINTGGGGVNTTITADGSGLATPQASFIYDFAAPVDLHSTGTGISNNPLVLDLFESVTGAFELIVTYTSSVGSASFSAITVSAPGAVTVDGRDLGNGLLASTVDQVRLDFRATALGIVDGASGAQFSNTSASIAAVPEPTSIALLGLTGLGGIVVARRRRKQTEAAA